MHHGRHTYERSREIAAQEEPFYALIMAAMRQADTQNLDRLKAAFPDTYEELQARYWAPGGILETDPDWMKESKS